MDKERQKKVRHIEIIRDGKRCRERDIQKAEKMKKFETNEKKEK